MKKIQGFYVRALNSQKIYAKIKWEHCKFQPAVTLRILVRLKNSKCFESRMMRSPCLWYFMDFAHGQIYSSGTLDMQWPQSNNKIPTTDKTHQILHQCQE